MPSAPRCSTSSSSPWPARPRLCSADSCFWPAGQLAWGSELSDFLGLLGFYMVAFGCVLNLLPFTLSEGTRRHPGVAVRTDGGVILDLLRLIASLRTDSGT